MAGVIQEVQRPTLVIAHNKTLAAQLCNEFRTFFPDNAVEYFVSLLRLLPARGLRPEPGPLHREGLGDQRGDRPPAPRRDRRAVRAPRRDHRRLASRAIFGLGSPETYDANMQVLKRGDDDRPRRAAAQARLDPVHAQRHRARPRHVPRARRDARDLPRLRGDRLPRDALRRRGRAPPALRPAHRRAHRGRPRARRDLAGDALQRQGGHDRARGRGDRRASSTSAAPSSRPRASCSSRTACASARSTTWRCCARWASATASRTTRASSTAARPARGPYCLIDYFPDDFVCFIDESHQTVPQIGGMYEGDRSRKQTLVDYGFRLPSALDNRPQTFDEFLSITPQIVFVSATPGEYERDPLRARRRADRPPDRHRRPDGRRARDAQPDRRPHERGPRARRPRRARPGHHADEEDERGPHRLPARDGLQGPLPALGDRHARAHPDHPRPAAGRVRRARRRQPPARGARPARGLARRDPRRRQGGLPARRDLADPDDRPRRPQRRGHGDHVRRQGDRAMRAALAETDRRRAIQLAYNEEHGITPRRSSRASPTSPSSCRPSRKVPPARAAGAHARKAKAERR